MALTLCGLCGLLSIAVFFLTGAITPSNWTYVAQLPGSSSSVSAGPFMTAITSVSFFTAGLPLCLWSACSHRPCGSRVRSRFFWFLVCLRVSYIHNMLLCSSLAYCVSPCLVDFTYTTRRVSLQ